MYEEGVIEKTDLMERLEKLKEEQRVTEERIAPLELQLTSIGKKEINYDMVKEVMTNFVSSYKKQLQQSRKNSYYIC